MENVINDNLKKPLRKRSVRSLIVRILYTLREALFESGRYAIYPAMILIAVWFIGRSLEAIYHTTIFESGFTRLTAVTIFLLLTLYVCSSLILYYKELKTLREMKNEIACWIFFAILIFTFVILNQHYRVAATGFFATLAGSSDQTQESIFLLFKNHSLIPFLPINVFAAKVAGLKLDVGVIAPYLWSPSVLFTFFVWSIIYGSLLLRFGGAKLMKTIHLCLAAVGLVNIMMIKTTSTFTNDQVLYFQIGSIILILLQVLLTYSSLRIKAASKDDGIEEVSASPVLPPNVAKIVVFLLLVFPLLADIQNQYAMDLQYSVVGQHIFSLDSKTKPEYYVTATQLRIRNGPALSSKAVGILQEGVKISVTEERYGWYRIGENMWVSSKYLSSCKGVQNILEKNYE